MTRNKGIHQALRFVWTDGTNPDFVRFSADMEQYYNVLAGGAENRRTFITHNSLADIHHVLMVYQGTVPVGCGAWKQYDQRSAEMKRIWVPEAYRGRGIARQLIARLEENARESGFSAIILQTREACIAACALYRSLGYVRRENYPPYVDMPLAICFEKAL